MCVCVCVLDSKGKVEVFYDKVLLFFFLKITGDALYNTHFCSF